MDKMTEDKMMADYHEALEAQKNTTIGKQIFDFRENELMVTIETLSQMIGLDVDALRKIESNQVIPSLKNVSKLVKLGLDADTLSLTAWL